MLNTLLYTGIRVGELCALGWNDISPDFTMMRIDESFTDLKYETDTKTASGVRNIPLNSFLQEKYREKYNSMTIEEKEDRNRLIYINKCNNPYTSANISTRLRYIKRYIRENMNEEIDDSITPHYFRHTFTTLGIESGVSLKDMQELLGHANTKTLLDIYSHTSTGSKANSVNLIQQTINTNFKNRLSS